MFFLHYGNDLEALTLRLADDLRCELDDAKDLQAEVILIPQASLRRWLHLRLSEHNRVLANVQFLTPSEYIWQLLRQLDASNIKANRSDPKIARWALYGILRSERDFWRQKYPELKTILVADATGPERDFLFADELAHSFERYQAYRRDWLRDWDQGLEDRDWQAALWRRLWQSHSSASRAQLLDRFFKLNEYEFTQLQLPKRLFVFACSNISPDAFAVLARYSRSYSLHFYFPTPCLAYWGDVQTRKQHARVNSLDLLDDDNPLLIENASAGREFIQMLYSDQFVTPIEQDSCEYLPNTSQLLGRIQFDVLNRLAPKAMTIDHAQLMPNWDDSVQIDGAGSRLAEVENLHVRIIELLNRDQSIRPRDIAVLAPNMSDYASFVEAVFGASKNASKRSIPFHLSSQEQLGEHPLSIAILKLLELLQSDFAVDDIASLFECEALRNRFDLSHDEIILVRSRLALMDVRWGIDATHRAQRQASELESGTWQWALDRVLLGAAFGEAQLSSGFNSIDLGINTTNAILPAMLSLLERMQFWRANFSVETTMLSWQSKLLQFIEDFFLARELADERILSEWRSLFEQFAQQQMFAADQSQCDFRLISVLIKKSIEEKESDLPWLGGGITFSRMIPLRLVPFRVICLLGMNESEFPASAPYSELNRIDHARLRGHRRAGDRDTRQDDRFLFLQLLLAARDKFWISYQNQDAHKGISKLPSVVVQELQEMLPIYSVNLQTGASENRTSKQNTRVLRRSSTMNTLTARPSVEKISRLEQLIRFWKNPAREFLQKGLGLGLHAREINLTSLDQFESPDYLEQKKLFNAIFEQIARAPNIDLIQVLSNLRTSDLVADQIEASIMISPLVQKAKQLHRFVYAKNIVSFETQEVALAIDPDQTLRAEIRVDSSRVLRQFLLGKENAYDLIEFQLKALTAFATNIVATAELVVLSNEGKISRFELSNSGHANALARLRDFLRLAELGQSQFVAFLPNHAWQFAYDVCAKSKDQIDAYHSCQQQYAAQSHADKLRQPELDLIFRGTNPFAQLSTNQRSQFCHLATQFFQEFVIPTAPDVEEIE